MTATEIASNWTNLNVYHMPYLVETKQQFEQRELRSTDKRFRQKTKQLNLPNGGILFVSNQFNPISINSLIEKLNASNLGVVISLIEN